MEAVYGWVKNIIYYMIFLSVVNNLLADSKYEKYIRFFAGMVLILLVVNPFTGSLRLDQQISSLFQSVTFQNDADDLKVELWGMEDRRLEQIISQYEEAVKNDVTAMAEAEGLSCIYAEVTIDSDRDSSQYGRVTDIWLELEEAQQGDSDNGSYMGSRAVNVDSTQIGSIQVEPIALGEEGQSEGRQSAVKPEDNTTPLVLQSKIDGLTGKVAGYYGLERSHIKIWWKND